MSKIILSRIFQLALAICLVLFLMPTSRVYADSTTQDNGGISLMNLDHLWLGYARKSDFFKSIRNRLEQAGQSPEQIDQLLIDSLHNVRGLDSPSHRTGFGLALTEPQLEPTYPTLMYREPGYVTLGRSSFHIIEYGAEVGSGIGIRTATSFASKNRILSGGEEQFLKRLARQFLNSYTRYAVDLRALRRLENRLGVRDGALSSEESMRLADWQHDCNFSRADFVQWVGEDAVRQLETTNPQSLMDLPGAGR